MALFAPSDLRDAARSLFRAPTISISAILCLALGLGATTAISSAIDRALLQPPPFRSPDGLVTVYRTTPHFKTGPFSAPNYLDLTKSSKTLSSLAAVSYASALLTSNNESTQVTSLDVTGNLFHMLGVTAQVGRLLMPADDARDQNKIVVLSDKLWRERFNADPAIVNHSILLDGESVLVVGIAPKEFRIPRGGSVLSAQIWRPLRFNDGQLSQRRSNFLPLLGRLAPGVSPTMADKELNTLFDGLVTSFPELRGEGIHVVGLTDDATAGVKTPLLLMFGAVVMVLLIASTNVAALLLARGVHRRRETAIRAALGGNRWAVMRPIILESALLSVIGVVGGIGLAWLGVRTIATLAAERLPQLIGVGVDVRVVIFAVALALIVALTCAVVPAWRSTSVDPQEALRDGRGGGMGRKQYRTLGVLVITEVALSLVLLVGAGLVLKGFSSVSSTDPGFDPDPILTFNLTIPRQSYPKGLEPVTRFLEPALDAISHVPGVAAASTIQLLPYQSWGWNFNVRYEGQDAVDPTQRPLAETRIVTPAFFDVTKQRLLAGRRLQQSDDDRDASPSVVVVSQALVDRDFKGKDPIGKRFYSGDTTFTTIVGVVSNIKNVGPFNPPAAEMYFTTRQNFVGSTTFPIMVRVQHGDPMAVLPAIRTAIKGIDPLAAINSQQTMNTIITASYGQPRFYLILLGTFALVAIILAVAGLYGVMSYAVAQRTRELGIRSALGSSAKRTISLVASQGMRLIGVGMLLGMIGAFALTRLLTNLLYGTSPLDPISWVLASGVLVLAGAVAVVVPALRAVRIDPLQAIRSE